MTTLGIDQQPLPDNTATEAPEASQESQFYEAGQYAARHLLRLHGKPGAVAWFIQNAPSPHEPEAIAASGRPTPFWVGMHSEIMSVGGTA